MSEIEQRMADASVLANGIRRECEESYGNRVSSDFFAIGMMSSMLVNLLDNDPDTVKWMRNRVKELIAKGNAA